MPNDDAMISPVRLSFSQIVPPIMQQQWYEDIGFLFLYFVNAQSVHFLAFVKRVYLYNDYIRILLWNIGSHSMVYMAAEQGVFVRCCLIMVVAPISWAS